MLNSEGYGNRLPRPTTAKARWKCQVANLPELPASRWGETLPPPLPYHPARTHIPPVFFEAGLQVRVHSPHPLLPIEPSMAEDIYLKALAGNAETLAATLGKLHTWHAEVVKSETERMIMERADATAAAEEAARLAAPPSLPAPPKLSAAEVAAQEAEAAAKEAAALADISKQVQSSLQWTMFDINIGKYPLLALVAGRGFAEAIPILLDAGHSIDAVSDSGHTALHRAASRGHLGSLTALLERGAKVDAASEDGTTALQEAATEGHKAVFDILLDAPDPDAVPVDLPDPGVESKGGKGPSSAELAAAGEAAAIEASYLRVTERLRRRDLSGCTPLMVACAGGHVEIAEAILDRLSAMATAKEENALAADKEAEDADKKAGKGKGDKGEANDVKLSKEELKALEEAEATAKIEAEAARVRGAGEQACKIALEAADDAGLTAVHHAVFNHGANSPISSLLVSKGASRNQSTTRGARPMDNIARSQEVELSRRLSAARARPVGDVMASQKQDADMQRSILAAMASGDPGTPPGTAPEDGRARGMRKELPTRRPRPGTAPPSRQNKK